MSDYDKGYFGTKLTGSTYAEQQGIDARIRKQQEQQRPAPPPPVIKPWLPEPGPSGTRNGGATVPGDPASFSDMVRTFAILGTIAMGLWGYFIGHYPIGWALSKWLLTGFVAGAAVGAALWLLGQALQLFGKLLGMALRLAFWAALAFVILYFLGGALPA